MAGSKELTPRDVTDVGITLGVFATMADSDGVAASKAREAVVAEAQAVKERATRAYRADGSVKYAGHGLTPKELRDLHRNLGAVRAAKNSQETADAVFAQVAQIKADGLLHDETEDPAKPLPDVPYPGQRFEMAGIPFTVEEVADLVVKCRDEQTGQITHWSRAGYHPGMGTPLPDVGE